MNKMNYDWIKDVPNYTTYFNEEHLLIIEVIGIDNYLRLYEHFGKSGIYFSYARTDGSGYNDRQIIINLIGEEGYEALYSRFGKTGIYFSSSSIMSLKKAFVNLNRHLHYNEVARMLDVSVKTIYKWRAEEITNLN